MSNDKITKTEAEWREQLTPEQYYVARERQADHRAEPGHCVGPVLSVAGTRRSCWPVGEHRFSRGDESGAGRRGYHAP